MKISRLEKRLQKSKDKLSIFANKRLLNRYRISEEELERLIEVYLTDEQKAKLFQIAHFRSLFPYRIKAIIELIKDDRLKLELLKDDELLSDMTEFNIMDIIKSLEDDGKIKVLKDANLIKKYNMDEYSVKNTIMSFTEEGKKKLLLDKEFLENELEIGKYHISTIIASLESEEEKLKFMDKYELGNYKTEILTTLSDEYKRIALTGNKYDFKTNEIYLILTSMETNSIINFINENKQFCTKERIKPDIIMGAIDSKKQLEFISKLDNIEDLTIRRKKKNICKIRKTRKRKNWKRRLSKRM